MSSPFMHKYRQLCRDMLIAPIIHTGSWQSTDTSSSPMHATHELEDVLFSSHLPALSLDIIQREMPVINLPWAELHFQERVGGVPLNPPPSHTQWPWARHNARFQEGEQGPFSHSYPERMWPRHANNCHNGYAFTGPLGDVEPVDRHGQADSGVLVCQGRQGIRFRYGDLDDVVDLLVREPLTRQAYLPIWFPEDTGTHHGERVPCTLGYHFMIRDNRLTCRYYMRSCDLVRHFPDDVYMACRLTQWICEQINQRVLPPPGDDYTIAPGHLRMYISSLHAFVGDKYMLQRIVDGAMPS